MEIDQAIKKYKQLIADWPEATEAERGRWELAIEALEEKKERDKRMQWLDDIDNPLEPIKIEAALRSEIMKLEFRHEHDPNKISELDYTIIHVLAKALETALETARR